MALLSAARASASFKAIVRSVPDADPVPTVGPELSARPLEPKNVAEVQPSCWRSVSVSPFTEGGAQDVSPAPAPWTPNLAMRL